MSSPRRSRLSAPETGRTRWGSTVFETLRWLTSGLGLPSPLAPPSDATRSANGMSCSCRDCAGFRAFLAHPTARIRSLKAAKATRALVQSHIQAARCDVECRTDTRGNPHTLICTKSQANYDARVKQREADTSAVARLA